MKVPYSEDLASHTGPESCIYIGNGMCEALTGGHVGQVLSRENILTLGCRRHRGVRKATFGVSLKARYIRTPRGLRPCARMTSFLRENREILCSTLVMAPRSGSEILRE